MATLKITQIKSRIGATEQQCKNLDALGLRKVNRTVEHSDSAIILGMIERVKHLVKVEVVEAKKAAKKATKKAEDTFMHWRRKWQLTPVFLPGESQGQGSLAGCRLWGRTESDTTEAT